MTCSSIDFTAMFRYDITLQSGVRFDENNAYFVRSIDGVAESLAGWTAVCELRDSVNGTLRLTLTTENGGILLNDVTDGAVYLRITHDQTAALDFRDNRGVYLLRLINLSGEPSWFGWGKIAMEKWG
jgi:hypothetical protein